MASSIDPTAYLRSRIQILRSQIAEVNEEMEDRTRDHDLISESLNGAKQAYTAALTDEWALERLSLGTSFTERRQRMQQIIRGVNTGLFDELRTYKAFLKSLKAEKRRLLREVNLLELRLQSLSI